MFSQPLTDIQVNNLTVYLLISRWRNPRVREDSERGQDRSADDAALRPRHADSLRGAGTVGARIHNAARGKRLF